MRILLLASLVALAIGSQPSNAAEGVETLLAIEPSQEFPRNSEGDIVELKDGRLCLVYTRFTGGGDDNSTADLAMRTSSDGGKTWSDDRILVKNEGAENTMSVSILRLKSGELLLFYLVKNSWSDLNAYVRRSTDEFETLSEPVCATTADGYNVVNNDRIVQLSTGRLIVPAAYHPCPEGKREAWSNRGIMKVSYSDDGGKTWQGDSTDVNIVPDPAVTLQEPGVVELKDGRLMMYIRTDGGSQFESFSSDGGIHWTKPVPGKLASPLSPATIERIPWTGDLLAVWNDHSGWHNFPKGKRTPLCVAISKDDGKTWSKSRVIEGDPDGWYCYTAIAYVGDRVLLAYCAGDKDVGGLNRLKVTALSKDWLCMD